MAIQQQQAKVQKQQTEESTCRQVSFGEHLTSAQSLVFEGLREGKVIFASVDFVYENLGKTFVESPSINLNTLFADVGTTSLSLIFMLLTALDPMNAFMRCSRNVLQRKFLV